MNSRLDTKTYQISRFSHLLIFMWLGGGIRSPSAPFKVVFEMLTSEGVIMQDIQV